VSYQIARPPAQRQDVLQMEPDVLGDVAIRLQVRERQFREAEDPREEVVEIVRYAGRQGAERFHALRVEELLLQLPERFFSTDVLEFFRHAGVQDIQQGDVRGGEPSRLGPVEGQRSEDLSGASIAKGSAPVKLRAGRAQLRVLWETPPCVSIADIRAPIGEDAFKGRSHDRDFSLMLEESSSIPTHDAQRPHSLFTTAEKDARDVEQLSQNPDDPIEERLASAFAQ
jgi:hypothetical protein